MPASLPPGRSFVTRRATLDIIRTAVLGSYGVTGFAEPSLVRRLLGRLGFPGRGIGLRFDGGVAIELSVTVAHGLPVAEVVRQLDSAVRYAVRHAVGREVARLVIHVDGLEVPDPVLVRPTDTAADPGAGDPVASTSATNLRSPADAGSTAAGARWRRVRSGTGSGT